MVSSLVVAASVAAAAPSRAQNARDDGADANAAPSRVRIALSARAAERLSEARVRRLVEIQLAGAATVPSEAVGPLDENAVRVFIDLPDPSVATIQVQGPGRRLAARRVDVSGLPWDAATRFVAIATSESVRVQLRPVARPRPKAPTPDEIAARLGRTPSLEVGGALAAAWLPDPGVGLFGPRLRLSFHPRWVSEHVTLTALGSSSTGAWLEGGLGASHRTFWTPDVRTHVGAGLGVAGAFDLEGEDEDEDADLWIRGHALLGLGLRTSASAWFSFDLEPGFTVDARRERTGPYVGGAVQISFDGALDGDG